MSFSWTPLANVSVLSATESGRSVASLMLLNTSSDSPSESSTFRIPSPTWSLTLEGPIFVAYSADLLCWLVVGEPCIGDNARGFGSGEGSDNFVGEGGLELSAEADLGVGSGVLD